MWTRIALLAVAIAPAAGQGNAAGPMTGPPGTPFPKTTYPDAISPNPAVAEGTKDFQNSPPHYPSPWGTGTGDWAEAYAKATALVSKMTLLEKVNVTTGVG